MTAGRPRLLLLHGFTGRAQAFDAVLARLEGEPTLLVPSLLGHGASPLDLDFEAEVDRLAALLDASSPWHVCGYSLGARLALGLLVRHRARFAGATLIGVNPGLSSEAERRARREQDEQWARLLEREGLAAFLNRWEAQPLFASQRALDSASLERQRQGRSGHTPAGLAAALRQLGLGSMPDYWQALPQLDLPITLLVGELDAKFRSIAATMVERLPHATLLVAPQSGHNLLLERPELVAQVLAEALAPRPGATNRLRSNRLSRRNQSV